MTVKGIWMQRSAKRVQRRTAVLGLLLVLPLGCFGPTLKACAAEGCIFCHTSVEKIASLYVPPEVEFTADEGEG